MARLSLGAHLKHLRESRGMPTRDVQEKTRLVRNKKMHISSGYLSAVELGRSVPSRWKLLGLAFAYGLTKEETTDLLQRAGEWLPGVVSESLPGTINIDIDVTEQMRLIRSNVQKNTLYIMKPWEIIAVPHIDQVLHAGSGGAGAPMDYSYFSKQEVGNKCLAIAFVRGDCMEPTIHEGERVVVDMDAVAVEGDVVAALVDSDEVIVRVLGEMQNGRVVLSCVNPDYPDEIVTRVRILGVIRDATRPIGRQVVRRG